MNLTQMGTQHRRIDRSSNSEVFFLKFCAKKQKKNKHLASHNPARQYTADRGGRKRLSVNSSEKIEAGVRIHNILNENILQGLEGEKNQLSLSVAQIEKCELELNLGNPAAKSGFRMLHIIKTNLFWRWA